MDGKIMSLQNK